MEYILLNEDYTTFCESDDNLTDDVEEAVPGPYDQWLNNHYYDPKTNTILVNGKRVNAGKVGSNKERNRMNKLLKTIDFDPSDGTYRSEIPLSDGSYARLPFYIGANKRGNEIASPGYNHPGGPDIAGKIKLDDRRQMRLRDSVKDDIKYNRNNINDIQKSLNEEELNDEQREDLIKKIKDLKKRNKENAKKLRSDPTVAIEPTADRQRMYLSDTSVNMSKRNMMKRIKDSMGNVKHEEGHADDYLYNKAPDMDNSTERVMLNEPFKYNGKVLDPKITNAAVLNDHTIRKNERYADVYSAKHNPYIKSSDDAVRSLKRDSVSMNIDNINRSGKLYKKKLKKFESNGVNTPEEDKRFKQTKSMLDNVDTVKKFINKPVNPLSFSDHARSEMLRAQLNDDPEFQKKKAKSYKEYMI